MDLYSQRRFVQWLIFIDLIDFQFKSIVFLVKIREMSKLFLYVFGMLVTEVPPSRHSCGDGGILQFKMVESLCITEFQKE